MDSAERLGWFGDNVEFFESIRDEDLSLSVPTCPGWTMLDLFKHLSFGLGVCYPIAATTPPATATEAVFADADRSCMSLEGTDAAEAFRMNMRSCLTALSTTDPDAPCWTYAGPGTASFWIRRAAAETTVHRFDAERALGETSVLAADRAEDGIDEALEFALPFAGAKIGAPASMLHLESTDSPLRRSIGSGEPEATLVGDGYSLLLKLWGRGSVDEVRIEGDESAATEWLTLVSRAFAGR